MRTSDYHNTHGLDGYLRATQTGELMHFRFERGTTKIHVTGMIGEHQVEGYLEVTEREGTTANDPLDRTLSLVLPGMTSAMPRSHSRQVAEGPFDPFKNHPAFQADLQRPQPTDENTTTEIAKTRPNNVFDMLDGTKEVVAERPSRTDDTVYPDPGQMTPQIERMPTKSNDELTILDSPDGERELIEAGQVEDPGVDTTVDVSEASTQPAEEKRAGKKSRR